MRTLAIAAALVGALGFAAPALAGYGHCYDAYGRPVGPAYDTDRPNYGFIQSVTRRGGSCTGVNTGYRQDYRNRGNRYYYDDPNYNRRRY
jgi:hypothetical protein